MKQLLKKAYLILLVSFVYVPDMFSQNVLDKTYVPEHAPSRLPIPYTSLREADVMWSQRMWRIIDLREKMNFPLYYPTTPIVSSGEDRKSLIDVILDGVKNEGLTAYSKGDIGTDDRFTTALTKSEIDLMGGAGTDTLWDTDENGEEKMKLVKKEFYSFEVKQLIVKEDWFFDRQRSVLDVRIIGICPVRFFTKEGSEEIQQEMLFWIYFPEARSIFAKKTAFNMSGNDTERRTYDDIFWKRTFSSYIIRESNVYDTRRIGSYRIGLAALLEAESIKDKIRLFEHDLWEY